MSELRDEVRAIRRSVAISRVDGVTVLRLPADDGAERLDPYVATNLGIREAQLRQALCLDVGGRPILDLLVGYFRGTVVALATGPEPAATLGADPGHVAADQSIIGIDGPFAWELLALWDTPGAIGLPYLGAYSPREGVLVVRAGRTGEYGYLIVADRAEADAIHAELLVAGAQMDIREASEAALRHCSLENWVFELSRDTALGLDALELQLTWRLDVNKQAVGLDAIRAHREKGLARRITAIHASAAPVVGAPVTAGDQEIGAVLASAPRLFRHGHSVVAALSTRWAHPGMTYAIDGEPCTTLSAPFVLNRSLFVNPQRNSWATRDEIELPEGVLWPGTTSW